MSEVYSGMDSHYDVQMTPPIMRSCSISMTTAAGQSRTEDALSQEEEYTYDNAGNLLTLTDRNGRYTVYTYDVRGNVLTESIYADIYARTRHPS